MSNERSPREVCSITIGTTWFISTRAPPRAPAPRRARGRRRPRGLRPPRRHQQPPRERRSRPGTPLRPASRRSPRSSRPRGARGRRRARPRPPRGSAPTPKAHGPRGSRTRSRDRALRAPPEAAAGTLPPAAAAPARDRRKGRCAGGFARARARPARSSSRGRAAAPRRPRPAAAGRLSFVLLLLPEPREDGCAGEAPFLSHLAAGQLLPFGQLDHGLLVHLEELGELRRRQHLGRLGGTERMPADSPFGFRARSLRPAYPGPNRVFGIEVRDELRDQLALRRPQHVRGPVELLGLGGRDAHEERRVVGFASRSRHSRYLEISNRYLARKRELRAY